MFKSRIAIVTLAIALVAALPAAAQFLPAGPDNWVTPGDGQTFFTFPAGDVESLCGAPVSFSWNRQVGLAGVPVPGADWDTQVTRLQDANLSGGSASVAIQVTHLGFRSIAPQSTPCGNISWDVKALDNQPVTKMELKMLDYVSTNNARGGEFYATISVRVAFHGTDTSGNHVGTLYYTFDLPDQTGVPFSFDSSGNFRPGIDTNEDCTEVLRDKISTLPARHKYFIENLIAQGKCTRK